MSPSRTRTLLAGGATLLSLCLFSCTDAPPYEGLPDAQPVPRPVGVLGDVCHQGTWDGACNPELDCMTWSTLTQRSCTKGCSVKDPCLEGHCVLNPGQENGVCWATCEAQQEGDYTCPWGRPTDFNGLCLCQPGTNFADQGPL